MWELNWVRRGGGMGWELDDAGSICSDITGDGVRGRGNAIGGRREGREWD